MLAVEPDEVEAPQDPLLLNTVPDDVEVVRTGAIPRRWTRRIGLGSLVARSAVPIARAGARLLRDRPYDLVFFSTTALDLAALGPLWLKEFGVPYIVDLQDPWYSDYYRMTGVSPPGGKMKFALSNLMSRWLEPYVLRRASHVVSVSPQYPLDLSNRYPWFDPKRATVLPFGAPRVDFDVLKQTRVCNPIFDPHDRWSHWVYVGRAGHDMEFSLSALFTALAEERLHNPERYQSLRLHFVGTSYADGDSGESTVFPIAHRCGVGDIVSEQPRRISYFEALQCLVDADALLVPGSDDPGYTASKLYPYILAGKPLLAVFHEASTVLDILRQTGAGTVVSFGTEDGVGAVADRVQAAWFEPQAWSAPPATDWGAFEPYTAEEMTRRLTDVFDRGASSTARLT